MFSARLKMHGLGVVMILISNYAMHFASAEEPENVAEATVSVWIKALGHDEYPKREEAFKNLARVALKHRSAIIKARESTTDMEVKQRIGQLLDLATARVGAIFPLSGPLGDWGRDALAGMELAQAELKESESIPLAVLVNDDQSKAEEAVNQAKVLIKEKGACALFGFVASSSARAASQVWTENKVPVLTPMASNSSLNDNIYFSRACFEDAHQGEAAAKFLSEERKCKKTVVIADRAQAYSRALADRFDKAFAKHGGEVLERVFYDNGQADFAPLVKRVTELKPDGVFLAGYGAECGSILKQAGQQWKDMAKVGGDGLSMSQFFENAGDAANGCHMVGHFSPEDPNESVKTFVEKFEGKTGRKPTDSAVLSYDAFRLLHGAIQRAGSNDRDAIRKALSEVKGFQGVTGTISFDGKGNRVGGGVVLVAKDGAFRFAVRLADKE